MLKGVVWKKCRCVGRNKLLAEDSAPYKLSHILYLTSHSPPLRRPQPRLGLNHQITISRSYLVVSQGIPSLGHTLQPYRNVAKSLRNRSRNRTAKVPREAELISRLHKQHEPHPSPPRLQKQNPGTRNPWQERGRRAMFRSDTGRITSDERTRWYGLSRGGFRENGDVELKCETFSHRGLMLLMRDPDH